MTTRCNVLVRYNNYRCENEIIRQYYHHTDGYPEGIGRVLDAFLTSAQVCGKNENNLDFIFKMLLTAEGHFEDEGYYKNLHSDIEYLWYVDLVNCKLTYTKVNTFSLCPFDDQKKAEYFRKLKNSAEGEIRFNTEIVK